MASSNKEIGLFELDEAFAKGRISVEEYLRKRRSLVGELLVGSQRYLEEKKEPIKIFLSYCERNPENPYLIEDLIDPFLEELNFEVHYYKKNLKAGHPVTQIYELIDSCTLIIGFYTKDEKKENGTSMPAGNVIKELGYARDLVKLVLVEEGTRVESMTYSETPCIHFTRDRYGELLRDLLKFLKNSKLVTTETSFTIF